ncbi:MAG: M23 family metallopeptidase [Cytophagales bacterium]|nr:M23 family metallopeptidase [Cytophagales bacterium]
MEKILYFILHLGVPILILLILIKSRKHSKVSIIINTLLYSSVLLFLYLWGQYPLVFSYYFRFILLPIIFFALWKNYKNWSGTMNNFPSGWLRYLRVSIAFVLAILFSFLTVNAINGLSYDSTGVKLNFPLENGSYYISSGGNNKVINNHFRSYPNSQQFALDISKLNAFGAATSNPLSSENKLHYIYGESLYCPCNGVVIESANHVKDNKGASMDVSPEDGSGNYVVLECDDVIVSMVHLKYGSVLVNPGDRVVAGDPIGKVGNSGFSQEPHLHLQAAKYNQDSSLVGVPMSFGSSMPIRNTIIEN